MSVSIHPRRSVPLILNFLVVCLPTTCGTIAGEIDFDTQIAPIFAAHCIECHSSNEPNGSLALSHVENATKGGESGRLYIPKDSSKSLLWNRVSTDEMPPKHPLTDEQKAILKS